MLISRGGQLLRAMCRTSVRKNAAINSTQVRHSGRPMYRSKIEPTKSEYYATEFIVGIAWWWFLWFLYHEHEILRKGHLPGPVPHIFSDEELGIPPDDDDVL